MEEWLERYNVAGLEDGGRGSRVNKAGQPLEAGKGQEVDSFLELKENSPADTLILA